MSDMSDLHDYENRPKKKNPFRSKPIPKNKIEWAIKSTLSIRAAAILLGVSYNTFKKYAKLYNLFEFNMLCKNSKQQSRSRSKSKKIFVIFVLYKNDLLIRFFNHDF